MVRLPDGCRGPRFRQHIIREIPRGLRPARGLRPGGRPAASGTSKLSLYQNYRECNTVQLARCPQFSPAPACYPPGRRPLQSDYLGQSSPAFRVIHPRAGLSRDASYNTCTRLSDEGLIEPQDRVFVRTPPRSFRGGQLTKRGQHQRIPNKGMLCAPGSEGEQTYRGAFFDVQR